MNHKNRRLLLVGGEDVSLRIPAVRVLSETGYDVAVIGSEAEQVFINAAVQYFFYELDRGFTPILDIKTTYQLYVIFKNEKPDVVHTFDTKPNVLACIAARLAGVPKIIRTINGMGDIFSSKSFRHKCLTYLYNIAQYFSSGISSFTIFQNKDDMAYFTSRNLVSRPKAKYVAGSGICVEDFEGSAIKKVDLNKLKVDLNLGNRCTILLISRLIKAKGIIEYLEAAQELNRGSRALNFLLVGGIEPGVDGVEESKILEYSDVCCYLGHRSDVSSLMAISDIVVLPSYYKEGVPRTLIEGASMSKPLISTNVSGCRDIVIDQHNGLLVPIKNSDKLAQAILYLVNNPKIRLDMGQNGRQLVVEKFSLTKVCEGWAALY